MDLILAPLRDIACDLRSGNLKASALFAAARERYAETEERLQAYRTWAEASAMEAVALAEAAFAAGTDLGLLQGIPVSVKDLYGVPGLPVFAGTTQALPAKWQSAGPVVDALIRQHAVITGKTHTVEFAFGGSGLNRHVPTPRNPWDPDRHRTPGGSSSGAGVSLCQGTAVIAFGSDTAGSVRVPASLTGNVGFKPTKDRWPTTGIVPLSRLFDTPGLLARTVDDASLAIGEIDRKVGAGPSRDGAHAGSGMRFRIGIPEALFWDECETGIAECVRAAVAELERAGHHVIRVGFPEALEAFAIFRAGGTSGTELRALLEEELPEWLGGLDPFIAARIEASSGLSAVEWLRRVYRLETLAACAGNRFADLDLMATPTVAVSPRPLAELASLEAYRTFNQKVVRNTSIANLLGLCALTLPVGLDGQSMPVGLQLMAAAGNDTRLLDASLEIERTLGTWRERLGPLPPV